MFLFTIMICVKKRHKFRDSQSVITSWLFGKSKGPATGTHQTKGNERRFRFVRIRFLQTKHHADPVTRFESCQDHLTDQSATEDPKPPCSISLDFVRPLMSIYNEFFFRENKTRFVYFCCLQCHINISKSLQPVCWRNKLTETIQRGFSWCTACLLPGFTCSFKELGFGESSSVLLQSLSVNSSAAVTERSWEYCRNETNMEKPQSEQHEFSRK